VKSFCKIALTVHASTQDLLIYTVYQIDLILRAYLIQFLLRRFRDPIRVPRIENRVPRIKENYYRSLKSEKIGFLESEKSGPYRSILGT